MSEKKQMCWSHAVVDSQYVQFSKPNVDWEKWKHDLCQMFNLVIWICGKNQASC